MFALGKFDEFRSITMSSQGKRILNERIGIDKLCFQNNSISYFVHQRNGEGLPIEYEINYLINSFTGGGQPEEVEWDVDGEKITKSVRKPIIGEKHHMRITFPYYYPSANGNSKIKFTADILHLKTSGQPERSKEVPIPTGKTFGSPQASPPHHSHWAKPPVSALLFPGYIPLPGRRNIAEWVFEEAEAMGWISLSEVILTEYENLN